MDEETRRSSYILVIEDNPADVALLKLALDDAQVDYEMTVLEDGGAALDFIRQQDNATGASQPDLAILDLNLPKYDGVEILEAMRTSLAFSAVPIAVLSSSSAPRERARMDKYCVLRYITKPADLEEFMKIGAVIRELLQSVDRSRVSTATD